MNGTIEQVNTDVISQVSSLPGCQLHQWLTDITQRHQHVTAAATTADRLNTLSCDCTFCLPNVTASSAQTSKSSTASTTTTTTSSNKPVFSCASCSRSFTSKKYLNMHASLHRKTSADPATSTQPVLALSKSSADTVTISRKDRWTCEVCGKVFAHNSNYKNHIRTHSDERPFICHVCSIGFKERYHLKKHTLFKHTGELNEACRCCGKRFKDSTAVRAHERIHSDARPYSCQRCGKAFKTSECLWHHDHRSKTCGRPRRIAARQSAVIPATYQTSVQSVSADSLVSLTDLLDQTQCHSALSDVDIKSLLSSQSLSLTAPSSVTQVDSSNYVKTEDSLNFMLSSTELQADVNMMPTAISVPWLQTYSNKPVAVVIGQHVTGSGVKQRSVCSRCGKQFASAPAFERHLAVHSLTRPYRCHICDVGFKLKVHLKKHNLYRHNNDYPCQCKVCGKPFKDSSAVRLHERIHSSARPFQCACGKSFKTRENLWGHRHRRPCVGRYAAAPTSTSACLGEVKTPGQNRVDGYTSSGAEALTVSGGRFSETSSVAASVDLRQVSDGSGSVVTSAAAVMYSDGLLTFDGVPGELRDCFGVDSKLLPPFESFIPPLHGATETSANNQTSSAAICHHGFTDWPPVPLPHDVIWWPSNLQSSPTMMTSQPSRSDVTDDWSSDWQLPRKLSL